MLIAALSETDACHPQHLRGESNLNVHRLIIDKETVLNGEEERGKMTPMYQLYTVATPVPTAHVPPVYQLLDFLGNNLVIL